MSRFIKFLIMVAAVINLVLIFVFDGKIPSDLTFSTINNKEESQEAALETVEDQQTFAEEDAEPKTDNLVIETGEEESEEKEPEEELVPRCRIISQSGSNIRSGPGIGFEIVTDYPYDTVFILTGEAETGWYPILAEDGTEGYIFENQIEILDENNAEGNIPPMEDMTQ